MMLHSRQTRRKQQHLSRPKIFSCFNIFFALSILEAIALITISFGSDQLKLLGDATWLIDMAEEVFLWDALDGDGTLRSNEDDVVELEDGLAVQKAKELENELDDDNLIQAEANQEAATNLTSTEKVALDNYSKRLHIPNDLAVPLIVGGSDGSGTRAFVDVLGRLGVPMLVDDRGTMDIHATEMFKGGGWPPLVRLVLKELHTANYSINDLPQNLTSAALTQIAKLDAKLQMRSTRLRALAQAKKADHILAKGVKFGFKAPVSMLVLPLLLKHFGRIRFLHVVRDGRDVALSANQSPVQKFYRVYYRDPDRKVMELKNFSENDPKASLTTSRRNLMAMQLWNDWNTQVHDFEQHYVDGQTFDYLVMRTEDLLDPDTKFQALQQLANFVGSQLTKQQICCMSRRAVVDMGSSGGIGGIGRNGRFASMVRNRLTGMSREERIEALKRYRSSRTTSGSMGKPGVFLRHSQAEDPSHLTKIGSANKLSGRVVQTRRGDADGIGIPGVEQPLPVKSNGALSNDVRMSSIGAASILLEQKREDTSNDLGARTAKRVATRLEKQGGWGAALATRPVRKYRHRRRRLELSNSTSLPSVEEFRKEYLQWKREFSKVRLDPAKYAEDAYSKGESLLKKYGLISKAATGSANDDKERSELEKQVRAPMAHLSRLLDQIRSGKFKPVHERYGKWAKILSDRPEMKKRMHSEGASGLALFGYEPQAEFMDFRETDYTCDASVVCAA